MNDKITVALLGRTGSGKSTIANMLLNGDLSDDNFFGIGDSARGTTDSIDFIINEKIGIFDTVGLGENKRGNVEHSKAIKMIRNHFAVPFVSFNYICYVKAKDRFIDDDRKNFNEFKEIFSDCDRNIVIIITHCKQKWINENSQTIEDYFGNYPVIGVDFPSEDEDDDDGDKQKKKERRTQNLNHLLQTFSALNYKGIKIEVLSSLEATEDKVQRWFGFVPEFAVLYKITSAGVYYLKGKPKIAKRRLVEGTY
ncbi:18997_t:CDS:2 [Racocetra fulgida]|uniref:18997_t:CDS:1 n=1 Tax=Racocetra fulgida TaxID=60492 RepID=A0A9N9DW03_9GLOM|nr:18997_t:CDS:2 [Racocetra fulgida]